MTINLHMNENPYSPAKSIQKAAIKGLEKTNRYSESWFGFVITGNNQCFFKRQENNYGETVIFSRCAICLKTSP